MKEHPKLLIAGKNGKVYDAPFLEGAGMKGKEYFRMDPAKLTELHPDSELFLLPGRKPVAYDPASGEFVCLDSNPLVRGDEPCCAVAAFLAPGHMVTHNAAYRERPGAGMLPLFSYAAVVFYKDRFYASGIRVDREKRQELSGMDMKEVRKNVKLFRKGFPGNRLVRHLETCALCYGCPAAKNFFLKRYEGPLPSSPVCNARCIGCISYQPGKGCSVTQPRITFVPTPEEIAEVALFHINEARDPVVSFGQGCEGEPLMAGEVLVKAVDLIRKATAKGVINLNTNASRPDMIGKLFDAGLDSIRVSMNSVRDPYYSAYYKPRGYEFKDVIGSIKRARKAGGFVSINYLVMPGFTDSRREVVAFRRFLGKYDVNMVQWRNLNYDPARYFGKLKINVKREDMLGLDTSVKMVHEEFPNVMKGYFNPSKARIRRWRKAYK